MDLAIGSATTAIGADERWTGTRVFVVAFCFVLNMLDGADLLVMSFVAPILSTQWAIGPERLGVLFSASLAGMAIGCLVVAPFADRLGRRTMILGALALVAAAMLASGLARSVVELMLARLAVGVGVGTIGVCMTAMAAEFAPARHRSLAVGIVQAGWPFASIITAFAAVWFLAASGWATLFMAIGLLSAVLMLVALALLPESPAFLASGRARHGLARLNAVYGAMGLAVLDALPSRTPETSRTAVGALFAGGLARNSVLLWTAVTLGYFDLYFVISWIPKLANRAGLPVDQAIYAGAIYNLGAFVGTALVGALAVRFRLNSVIALFLIAAAAAMLVFGGVAMPVWLTLATALMVGVTVQGGFNGFWGLAVRLYPAAIRGTGVGWALGVGRIGAVAGPVVGGLLVGGGVSTTEIFAIYAVPLVAAALLTLSIRQGPAQDDAAH
ncbi:MFS transporter [Sphingomonas bacterium]|uniref:MFS transporter n=1 Tax=Sphingomonas bacterium TaxID=1895847 RepID=UPI0020C5B557|nr:MFS transporter [Sphingomonas bacterium]